LRQILQAWQKELPAAMKLMSHWAWDNTADLDPRCWPAR